MAYRSPPLLVPLVWLATRSYGIEGAAATRAGHVLVKLGRLDEAVAAYDAAIVTASRGMADYFVAAVQAFGGEAKLVANWVMGSVAAKLNEAGQDIAVSPVSPAQLAGLLKRIADNTISGKMAKEVFEAIWAGEGEADGIIESRGLKQVSDSGAIEAIVDEVLAANAAMVAEYKAGKEKAFNALVGQAMKATKGKANPQQVNDILRRKLAG